MLKCNVRHCMGTCTNAIFSVFLIIFKNIYFTFAVRLMCRTLGLIIKLYFIVNLYAYLCLYIPGDRNSTYSVDIYMYLFISSTCAWIYTALTNTAGFILNCHLLNSSQTIENKTDKAANSIKLDVSIAHACWGAARHITGVFLAHLNMFINVCLRRGKELFSEWKYIYIYIVFGNTDTLRVSGLFYCSYATSKLQYNHYFKK